MTFEQFQAGVQRTRALLKHGSAPNHLVRMAARESRPCRDCGLMIYLITCKDGSLQPFDGEGRSHYMTCPKGEEHRRRIGPMGASDEKPSKYFNRGETRAEFERDRMGQTGQDNASKTAATSPARETASFAAPLQESLFGSEPQPQERYPD